MDATTDAEATQGSRPLIAKLFADLPRGRVLDFGGGDGATAALLAAQGQKPLVVDSEAAAIAKASARGLETRLGGLDALVSFKEEFDSALLAHVVEHVQCPHDGLLPGVFNALKAGGKLVVAVPNAARLRNRVGLLFGQFSDGVVYQHVRFFTLATLERELTLTGFRVVSRHAHAYGALTRVAMVLSKNFGDEILLVAERPPDSAPARVVERSWSHS